MQSIYLDHAATTPLDPRVREVMLPYLDAEFGNPSSFHMIGKHAKDALEDARMRIAKLFNARPEEIFFTSGGTESNNLAVVGFARANKQRGKHLIASTVEHHSVLGAMEHLAKKEGFEVTYVPVDKYGQVQVSEIEKAIRPDTILVSVMMANNEIGTINPIAEIGKMLERRRKITNYKLQITKFHTDACQASGYLELSIPKLHVDLLTVNSSKIYGPKGAGLLYIKNGVKVEPLMFGGFQERGIRPGTENVAAIVGFAKALEIAFEERKQETARLTKLRDQLVSGILARIPKTRLNGHPTERLPNSANVSILDIEGEAMTLYLDAKGIEVSTGSACTSTSLDPSHVILATGLPYEAAHGSLRFTLGRGTTKADIDRVLAELPPLAEKLRAISPVHLSEEYTK